MRHAWGGVAQATAAQFAAVWLWDTTTWAPAGAPLEAHSLTVTQMAFSPDGRHLLTVSRDRTFALFARRPDASPPGVLFVPLAWPGCLQEPHSDVCPCAGSSLCRQHASA